MRLGRRTLLTAALAAVAAPAVLRLARADGAPATLKLHHFFSSVASPHDRFLAPWARKVEAESGSRIRIEIFPSMQLGGAPIHLFDQAHDGLADIVWAAPSHTPGRFPKIQAFELPFVPARRALVNSKALEDYAAANLKDEFREFHPICFSCRDSSALHAKRTIGTISDLKGMRLHAPHRLALESVDALGAQGVAMPAPQVAMAIAERVIDGCLDPWDVLPGLKLLDSLKAHTDFAESSLSSTTFILAMNVAAYDRLPRDLKTVIDANSGEMAASMAGAMWDADAAAVAATARERGDAITTLPPEEIARWRRSTEPVITAWLKEMKERRVNGQKLLADARASLEKYANESEPPSSQTPQAAVPEKTAVRPRQTQTLPPQPRELPASSTPAAAPIAPSAPAVKPPPKVLDIPL